MKISHDDDSWNASGVKRRDFRHDHSSPEIPRHKGKKKNTKKWCKGKIGVRHKFSREQKSFKFASISWSWIEKTCTVCGKVTNVYNKKGLR